MYTCLLKEAEKSDALELTKLTIVLSAFSSKAKEEVVSHAFKSAVPSALTLEL